MSERGQAGAESGAPGAVVGREEGAISWPRYRGTYRAAVVGHTGRGNYGHGLDLAFAGLPGVAVVAVADPDAAGRAAAQARTGAPRGYAAYGELLAREAPDLLAVGPRQPDQREAMLLAAIRAGVKAIYTEKPFARTLEEADRILAAAAERGVRIAVAHQNRAFPGPRLARRLVAEGRIGRLRALKAYGKQDRRGGGQDLTVLGTHMLDLMRFFSGDARWCHARVVDGGADATPGAVREGEEAVGPVVGDDIWAGYGFDGGVSGSYESARAADGGSGSDYFRLELCGTGGTISIWSSPTAPVYFCPRSFALPNHPEEWEALPTGSVQRELVAAGGLPEPPAGGGGRGAGPQASALGGGRGDEPAGGAGQRGGDRLPKGGRTGAGAMHAANQLLVVDLLAALEAGREPLSSGHDARAALEMIMAVYWSHMRAQRVPLPLAERAHPLLHWDRRAWDSPAGDSLAGAGLPSDRPAGGAGGAVL